MEYLLFLAALMFITSLVFYFSLKASFESRLREQAKLWQETVETEKINHSRQYKLWIEQNLDEAKYKVSLQEKVIEQAQNLFQEWAKREIESIKQEQKHLAIREANIQLEQWKNNKEVAIRQDAIERSKSVIAGKVAEHFIPFLPNFTYNPKDARFIGSPIDFIVFDGMDEGEIKSIIILEVKTGDAKLSEREKQIKNVIKLNKVRWEEIRTNRKIEHSLPFDSDYK